MASRSTQSALKRNARGSAEPVATEGSRRDEILELAARRFASNGYEATTIRQIAEDADILAGSIYHHFSTKDDIIEEIIRGPSVLLLEQARALLKCELDPETKLAAFILLCFDNVKKYSAAQVIVFHERRFIRRTKRLHWVEKLHAELFRGWLDLLQAGKAEGQFENDFDEFITVAMIIRQTTAFAEWFSYGEGYYSYITDQYELDKLVQAEIRLILRAIRTDERRNLPIPFEQALEVVSKLD